MMKTYIYTLLRLSLFAFILIGCSEDLVEKQTSGTLRGVVVKNKTNEPLANVKITTAPTTNTVFTAADGSFEITAMPMGDYSVKAELQGYMMEIKAANFKGEEQMVSLVFEMKDDDSFNSPPSIPELLSPADNAEGLPLSLPLTWNCTDPDDDELTYTIIIKNNRNSIVKTIKDYKEKTYQLDSLTFNTSYFWQVVASDGINDEVYSKTYKFTTNTVPENRYHFVRKIGDNHLIMSTDEAGNQFQFTKENNNSLRPRKNNSAGVVAFMRVVDGNAHIFTANPDGSNVFKVTNIPIAGFNISELDFSWNANGSEILYPSFNKLYRVNKDGSGTQMVYQTSDNSFISECTWSNDGSKIVLKTNDINGYNTKIFVIDMLGNVIKTVHSGLPGASGGLNLSVDGTKLLYTYDVSGYESSTYRQLKTHVFIYDFNTDTNTDVSVFTEIPDGYIDVDPRFSPNEAEIIFTQTSNDGISQKDVYKASISDQDSRKLLFSNAWMPDWE